MPTSCHQRARSRSSVASSSDAGDGEQHAPAAPTPGPSGCAGPRTTRSASRASDSARPDAYGACTAMATAPATTPAPSVIHSSTRMRRRRRPAGHTTTRKTRPPASDGQRRVRHEPGDAEHGAGGRVAAVLGQQPGDEAGVARRVAGADLERERAVHRMGVGRHDPPRHDVGAVGRGAGRHGDLRVVAVRVVGGADVELVAGAVVEADGAEGDLDRLVERSEICVGDCVRTAPFGGSDESRLAWAAAGPASASSATTTMARAPSARRIRMVVAAGRVRVPGRSPARGRVLRLELEGQRVHAVALAGRLRAVGEDVAEVRPAPVAAHLDPHHAVGCGR